MFVGPAGRGKVLSGNQEAKAPTGNGLEGMTPGRVPKGIINTFRPGGMPIRMRHFRPLLTRRRGNWKFPAADTNEMLSMGADMFVT